MLLWRPVWRGRAAGNAKDVRVESVLLEGGRRGTGPTLFILALRGQKWRYDLVKLEEGRDPVKSPGPRCISAADAVCLDWRRLGGYASREQVTCAQHVSFPGSFPSSCTALYLLSQNNPLNDVSSTDYLQDDVQEAGLP